jgi:hypothetical protein
MIDKYCKTVNCIWLCHKLSSLEVDVIISRIDLYDNFILYFFLPLPFLSAEGSFGLGSGLFGFDFRFGASFGAEVVACEDDTVALEADLVILDVVATLEDDATVLEVDALTSEDDGVILEVEVALVADIVDFERAEVLEVLDCKPRCEKFSGSCCWEWTWNRSWFLRCWCFCWRRWLLRRTGFPACIA